MKYKHIPEVKKEIAEKSQRDIESVNAYMDTLKGTVVSIQMIRNGQPRPYADSVDEALIFAHQPNMWTTNGPALRHISRDEAAVLARMFVADWEDKPVFLDSRLESLCPEVDPCGIDSKPGRDDERAACWRVIIRHPYND